MLSSLSRFIAISVITASSVLGATNSLQQVTAFGTDLTNIGMYTYKPNGLVSNPALIVAMHYCTGTAQAYFSGMQYANLADTYKTFMIIYPNAPDSRGCWDVHTTATLMHNSGGDSLGIASMVRYVIANYGVDASHVFMTGTSSGGMMTNVLAGVYPDLFVTRAAFCGIPYACFAGASSWSTSCAQGTLTKTAQEWGNLMRAGYSGYTGSCPKMQIWHGTTDQTLSYNNFGEAIKEWSNVFRYSITGAPSQSNSPLSGWTHTTYGPSFQAISTQGMDHNIPIQVNDVLAWFGLTGATTTPTSTTIMTSIPPVTTPPMTTMSASGATQMHWGQCGGSGWTGATLCASPYTCKVSNTWHSQCL